MALSDLTDEQWFARLNARRVRQLIETVQLWEYYDNEQPLRYVAKIIEEQGDRFPPLKINWSALFVDVLEERIEMQGWRIAGAVSEDDDLTAIWEDNDLAEAQGEGNIASLVARQSYMMVGPGIDTDTPLVTMEYPDQVAVEIDPATGRTIAALKTWSSDTEAKTHDMATLYLPGRMVTFSSGEKAAQTTDLPWARTLEASQTSPLVPVVPTFNRRRRWQGFSELRDLIPLVDAVNQVATNMLAAIEHHALPRRWAVGLSEADFTDSDGKPLKAWQIATGAVWAIPRSEDDTGVVGEEAQPKVGQFTAADLQNFHGSIRTLALLASSLGGLDPRLLGVNSENPASADAIRAAEARLIKRAERQQRGRSAPWRQTARIGLAVLERDPNTRIEPIWRDPSTPTVSAMADAAQKKLAAGIIDVEQAQEDCGYSLAQRVAMRNRRASSIGQADQIIAGIRGLPVAGNPTGAADPAPTEPAADPIPA